MNIEDLPIQPKSRSFGWDRGTPIDRLYIRKFLEEHKDKIKGRVAEFGDDRYSAMFGVADSAYVLKWPECDLNKPELLPSNHFDCIICTQVLNFLPDVQQAAHSLYQMLKPGGIALVTMHCISQKSTWDAKQWGHYWAIYPDAAFLVFAKAFGLNYMMRTYGNLWAACLYLEGRVVEEYDEERLLVYDPDYPITICVAAQKR